MKYLEIREKKGWFRRDEEMVEIEEITKDDLLNLLDHAHEADFEMDEFDEGELPNKAQQIIYENLYRKLNEFLENKEQFSQQANNLYAEAIGEYGADIESESEVDNETEVVEKEKVEEDDINPDDIPF